MPSEAIEGAHSSAAASETMKPSGSRTAPAWIRAALTSSHRSTYSEGRSSQTSRHRPGTHEKAGSAGPSVESADLAESGVPSRTVPAVLTRAARMARSTVSNATTKVAPSKPTEVARPLVATEMSPPTFTPASESSVA